jgi:hypothetical protein
VGQVGVVDFDAREMFPLPGPPALPELGELLAGLEPAARRRAGNDASKSTGSVPTTLFRLRLPRSPRLLPDPSPAEGEIRLTAGIAGSESGKFY